MNATQAAEAVAAKDAAVLGVEAVNGPAFWELVGDMLKARRGDWVAEHVEDMVAYYGPRAIPGTCPTCGRKDGEADRHPMDAVRHGSRGPVYTPGGMLVMADETGEPCVRCFRLITRAFKASGRALPTLD